MSWFRFYEDTIQDRKIRRLSPAQRWMWVTILCLAKQSPIQGKLLVAESVPMTLEDIQDSANIPFEEVEEGIKRLQQLEMLHEEDEAYIVTNWDKRQFTSDNSTERSKRHRKRQRNDNATLQGRSDNNEETPPEYRVQITETDQDRKEHVVSDETTHAFQTQMLGTEDSVSEGAHQNGGKAHKRPAENSDYTDAFQTFWGFYPRKNTGKKPAFRCWNTCLRKGFSEFDLITAAKNYAVYCDLMGFGLSKTKLAATFIGPDEHFTDFVDGVPSEAYESSHRSKSGQAIEAYASEMEVMTNGQKTDSFRVHATFSSVPERDFE